MLCLYYLSFLILFGLFYFYVNKLSCLSLFFVDKNIFSVQVLVSKALRLSFSTGSNFFFFVFWLPFCILRVLCVFLKAFNVCFPFFF